MTEMTKHVAVIGGGIGGVTLAYRLAQGGQRVTIYERSNNLGGLATFLPYGDSRIDRFYHTILTSDLSLQALIHETGVAERMHFTATKQGFYDNGKLYSFTTPVDFLLFPPLNLFQRFRIGLQVIFAQFENDVTKMDSMPVEDWLVRISGRSVYNKVWKPLLRAKFDSEAVDVPATYIWSRLRRMMSTRKGVISKEMMCYLEGGYYTLIEAIADACDQLGVTVRLNTAIEEIIIENGRAVGVRTNEGLLHYDAIVSTLQSPILAGLVPGAPQAFQDTLAGQKYLGVLCPLLILKERLTPYYVLNITDESIPFTAVVETTNLIDPMHVGGNHLVYLPKYISPDNEMARWPDEQVKAEWLKHFTRMFPSYDQTNIREFIVQRARYVEPMCPIGATDQIPTIATPVERLYMSNSAMVYPELNNGESITRLAAKTVSIVLDELREVTAPHAVPSAQLGYGATAAESPSMVSGG